MTTNLFVDAINAHRALLGLPPLVDDSNEPVQVGSPLWNRLTLVDHCSGCGCEAAEWNDENEDYICDDCRRASARGQREDERLDSPRHGQAAEINRKR